MSSLLNHVVLILDTDLKIAEQMAKILQSIGLEAHYSLDFDKAHKLIDDISPHLVILGLNLESKDDLLFYKNNLLKLKSLNSRIIFLSHSSKKTEFMKARSLGGHDFLLLPINSSVLIKKVKRQLLEINTKTINVENLELNVISSISGEISKLSEHEIILLSPVKPSKDESINILTHRLGNVALDSCQLVSNGFSSLTSSGQYSSTIKLVAASQDVLMGIRSLRKEE